MAQKLQIRGCNRFQDILRCFWTSHAWDLLLLISSVWDGLAKILDLLRSHSHHDILSSEPKVFLWLYWDPRASCQEECSGIPMSLVTLDSRTTFCTEIWPAWNSMVLSRGGHFTIIGAILLRKLLLFYPECQEDSTDWFLQ